MREGEYNQDGERDVDYVGRALYLQGSFFNHSCSPNVNRIRAGRTMFFVAARDIEPEEELCITYINQGRLQSREERLEVLKESYHFECQCAICSHESAVPSDRLCQNCGCCSFHDDMCCICDAQRILSRLELEDIN